MLTQAQAQDIANTVETRIIAALEADTWLKTGGTGAIKKIAAKVVDMRGRAWWKNVLPCLVVSAYRVTDEPERATLGAHAMSVGCRIEYLTRAGDLATGRDAAQTMGTRIARWLKDEQTTAAKRINLLLDDGDGVVRGSRVDVFDERDEEGDGFWIQVVFDFEIAMRAEKASPDLFNTMRFDWANDTTAAADSDWLDVFAEYTVEFWMRTATASIPATQTIIAKWGASTANQAFRIDLTTAGKLSVTTRCSFAGTNRTWTSTAAVISDTAWHHFAVTLSSTVTAYKDGVAVAGSGDSLGVSLIQTGSATLTVGNRNSSGGYSFYGALAVIRLWNYQRTAAQVLTDMAAIKLGSAYAPAQAVDPGLVAEWTAAASDSLTFADQTGCGNTLTLGTASTKPVVSNGVGLLPTAGARTPVV